MKKHLKEFFNLILGFIILLSFYFASYFIIKFMRISFPPAILGLILFAISLLSGIIKEKWIKSVCNLLIDNMAMFLVPLFCGLIVYKSIIVKNWIAIFTVIFVTTTVIIIAVGLFTEWGIKFLRLNKIKELEREKR